MHHPTLTSLLVAASLSATSPAHAIEPTPIADMGQITKSAKMDSQLSALATQTATPASIATPTSPTNAPVVNQANLPIQGDNILIDAVATGTGDSLLADLERLGLAQGSSHGKWVSGLFPLSQLQELDALPSLKLVRPAYYVNNAGLVTSQGVRALKADTAVSQFNADGAGVKVGVMSDSYNCLQGAASSMVAGDLPTTIGVLREACPGGIDEGRAMMEIIHDVAPKASLAFHTAALGIADMANGIDKLVEAGTDVIVDDVIYLAEPMFQDGSIAQAVDRAKARGVAYFSAAGNQSDQSYESAFRPSGSFLSGEEAHDFDPGVGVDTCQRINLPVGSQLKVALQWDEPFFSVTGLRGSANDLDVLLMDENCNTSFFALSAVGNQGGDPVEIISFANTTQNTTRFGLKILHFNPPGQVLPYAGRLKTVLFGGATFAEHATHSSSLYGHANAAGGLAVGAAYYKKTPAFGTTPAALETFSSLGGTPILFDSLGVRLATSIVREQPAVVAPDGVDTSFFFPNVDIDASGFPDFFGTSAAAPHLAGVAALMLGANASLTTDDLYQHLKNSALDMDNPYSLGFDAGFDFASGYGLVQADTAIWSALTTCQGKKATLIGSAKSETLVGTTRDDVIVGLGGDDRILGMGGNDTICGGPGNDMAVGGTGKDTCDAEKQTGCEKSIH